jgi:hypothetical protein
MPDKKMRFDNWFAECSQVRGELMSLAGQSVVFSARAIRRGGGGW